MIPCLKLTKSISDIKLDVENKNNSPEKCPFETIKETERPKSFETDG